MPSHNPVKKQLQSRFTWHINSIGLLVERKICSSSLSLLSHLIGRLPMMLPFFSTKTLTIADTSVRLSGMEIFIVYGFRLFSDFISKSSSFFSIDTFRISSFCKGCVKRIKTVVCPCSKQKR